MIFNIPGHIEMIRNGAKTQTRRINRGVYQIGRDYAVQSKRGAMAEEDIRIVIDAIRIETGKAVSISRSGREYANATEICITKKDAWDVGNYIPSLYESDFRKAYPKWSGWIRWVF